jgi:GAF domain-containing protein
VTRRGTVSRKPAKKTQQLRPTGPKRSNTASAARPASSIHADLQEQVGALTRELAEAREQHAATSEVLRQRTTDLSESLQQQTAAADVLKVISRSTFDLQVVLNTLVESASRLCEAYDSTIWRTESDRLLMVAHYGPIPVESLPLIRGTAAGRSVLDQRPVHVADMQTQVGEFPESSENARRWSFRAILCVPLMREGVAIGTVALRRTEAQLFTERQVALLQTFADQAVIAIENARLLNELRQRTDDLTETLEQQTATSEVLKVISRSPTDIQPVFDMIAESAARLCEAQFCFVYRFDGQLLHFVAHHGLTSEVLEINRRAYPALPSRKSVAARAILERTVVQIPDVRADSDYALGAMAAVGGYESAVGVPILRDGVPIGSIAVTRAQVGLLPQRQIDLLKTFAWLALSGSSVRLWSVASNPASFQKAQSNCCRPLRHNRY